VNLVRQVHRQETVFCFTDEFEALRTADHGARRHAKGGLIIDNDD
jgi:hypothetical protein